MSARWIDSAWCSAFREMNATVSSQRRVVMPVSNDAGAKRSVRRERRRRSRTS